VARAWQNWPERSIGGCISCLPISPGCLIGRSVPATASTVDVSSNRNTGTRVIRVAVRALLYRYIWPSRCTAATPPGAALAAGLKAMATANPIVRNDNFPIAANRISASVVRWRVCSAIHPPNLSAAIFYGQTHAASSRTATNGKIARLSM